MTLFEPGEAVSSPRLYLSGLDSEAPDAMIGWLEAVLAPEWTMADFEAAMETSQGVLISDYEGQPIGLALLKLDSPDQGDATLSFLAVDPQRRFRGLGGEAALALEHHVRARHEAQRFFAPVPEGRGLAVYFWLRLGYRPLSAAQAPHAPFGLTDDPQPGIWMLREAE